MNKAVNRLREVFGDDATEPRWIETLPLRGYRLLVKPETHNEALPARPPFRSLAVLPLENLSAGETQEYFSERHDRCSDRGVGADSLAPRHFFTIRFIDT